MFAITFTNGTVCTAERAVGVLSAGDPEGKKTYYVAQINGAKRRLKPEEVASIAQVIQ
jgi:hypothetical protein